MDSLEEYGMAVSQLLIDNVNAGLENLTQEQIDNVPIAAWVNNDGKLVYGIEQHFRKKLKPETLIEIDLLFS